MKEEMRLLPCKLTEEEKRQAARDHVQVCGKLAAMEEEKKLVTGGYKVKIDELKATESKLRDAHESGVEHRDVVCVENEDLDRGVRYLVRTDTGAMVDRETPIDPVVLSRKREEKRQLGLGIEEKSEREDLQ